MGASGIGQTSGGALSTRISNVFVRGRMTILGPNATPRAFLGALSSRRQVFDGHLGCHGATSARAGDTTCRLTAVDEDSSE